MNARIALIGFIAAALAGGCLVSISDPEPGTKPDASSGGGAGASAAGGAPDASSGGAAGSPGGAPNGGSSGALPADASSGCDNVIVDGFDAEPLGGSWDSRFEDNAQLAFDSTDYLSPPWSLKATGNPGVATARLSKDLARSKSLCCDVAVKTSSENFSFLRFESEGGNYGLNLAVGSGNVNLGESYYAGPDAGIAGHVLGSTSPPSGFQRYRLEVAFPPGTGAGTATLLADGVPVISESIGSADFDLGVDKIRLGIVYAEGPSAPSVLFDDVRCGTN